MADTTLPSRYGRRRFLGLAGAGFAGLALPLRAPAGATGTRTSAAGQAPRFRSYPFALGVASGDPLPDGVALWTRIAPDPVAPDGLGGVPRPHQPIPVRWEVATDGTFGARSLVRRGVATADPSLAHSVHVEVEGLGPDRVYWYRFLTGDEASPVGRTRTAPAPNARLSSMAFAFVSCQNSPAGHYTALRHLAEDDLDVVFHLGDYIYEGGATGSIGRAHLPTAETFTLADYRVRYGQYKADPDLQAAHASAPFVVVFDDHEVENNWAGAISQVDDEPDPDPARRRAGAVADRGYGGHATDLERDRPAEQGRRDRRHRRAGGELPERQLGRLRGSPRPPVQGRPRARRREHGDRLRRRARQPGGEPQAAVQGCGEPGGGRRVPGHVGELQRRWLRDHRAGSAAAGREPPHPLLQPAPGLPALHRHPRRAAHRLPHRSLRDLAGRSHRHPSYGLRRGGPARRRPDGGRHDHLSESAVAPGPGGRLLPQFRVEELGTSWSLSFSERHLTSWGRSSLGSGAARSCAGWLKSIGLGRCAPALDPWRSCPSTSTVPSRCPSPAGRPDHPMPGTCGGSPVTRPSRTTAATPTPSSAPTSPTPASWRSSGEPRPASSWATARRAPRTPCSCGRWPWRDPP